MKAHDTKPYEQSQLTISKHVEEQTNAIKSMQNAKNQEELKAQEAIVVGLVYQYEINEIVIRQLTETIARKEEMQRESNHAEEESKAFWQQYKEREDNIAKVDDRDTRSINDALMDLETQKNRLDEQILNLETKATTLQTKIEECDQKIDEINQKLNKWFGLPPPSEKADENKSAKVQATQIAQVMHQLHETSSDPHAKEKLQKTLTESNLDEGVKQKALILSTVYSAFHECINDAQEAKLKRCQEKIQGLAPEHQKDIMGVVEMSLEQKGLVEARKSHSNELDKVLQDLKECKQMRVNIEKEGESLIIRLASAEQKSSLRSGPGL